MNSNFEIEQIRAYAAAFEEGDAIWCDGKWWKASKLTKFSQSLTCEAPNQYVIRCYDGEVAIDGFREEEKPYRVTTLTDYKLQGGEKLVWLGNDDDNRVVFGKVYDTFIDGAGDVVYTNENYMNLVPEFGDWAVIPRYEQVKNSGKDDSDKVNDKMNERPASSHYHDNNNGNDVWKFADDNLSEERVKGFHQINAIKYVSRYHKKHDTVEKRIEDLEKAKVSIDKLIELERKG